MSSDWATLKGLNYFGQWFRRTRYDSQLWPPELRSWFDWHHGFGTKLTQEQFCVWLAEVADDDTLENYTYRVKTYEKWADIETISDTRVRNIKEMNFHTALGMTGFLSLKTRDGSYRPVFLDDCWIFREVLKGRINPIVDLYPDHPVGRGSGKKLAAAIDMLCYACRGDSVHDVLIRMDFAQGNPNWREKDIMAGGWFANLIEGKIYNVDITQLEAIADCIEIFLRKYNQPTIKFGVSELLAMINRDKTPNDALEKPSRIPESEIGQLVAWYCLGKSPDPKYYEEFVVNILDIKWDRWLEIEKGAKPKATELDAISYELRKSVDSLKTLYQMGASKTTKRVKL